MKQYIPSRNDIISIDFEPKRGKEVGKYRPAFILSSHEYNQKTGLLICCPISTSIRGHLTEVKLRQLDNPSVIATSIIHTLSWQERNIKFIANADAGIFDQVLQRILPLIGAEF
jgi:mRNA interferase MazF